LVEHVRSVEDALKALGARLSEPARQREAALSGGNLQSEPPHVNARVLKILREAQETSEQEAIYKAGVCPLIAGKELRPRIL
jgi:hypothetical protein